MKAGNSTTKDNRFGNAVNEQAFKLILSREQVRLFFALVEAADYTEVTGDVDEIWEYGFFTQGSGGESSILLTPAGTALFDLLTAAGMNPHEA